MGRARIYKYSNRRAHFTGILTRYSIQKNGNTATVLITEIIDKRRELVADHAWFSDASAFIKCGACEGDRVAFSARVRPYVNGYREDQFHLQVEKDYKLEDAGNVRVVKEEKKNRSKLRRLVDKIYDSTET